MKKVDAKLVAQLRSGKLKPKPAPREADEVHITDASRADIKKNMEEISKDLAPPAPDVPTPEEASKAALETAKRPLPLYVTQQEEAPHALRINGDLLKISPLLKMMYMAEPPEMTFSGPKLKRFIFTPDDATLETDTEESFDFRAQVNRDLVMSGFLPVYVGTPVFFMLLHGRTDPKNAGVISQWPQFISGQFLLRYYRALERALLHDNNVISMALREGSVERTVHMERMARIQESMKMMSNEITQKRQGEIFKCIRACFSAHQNHISWAHQKVKSTAAWVRQYRTELEELANQLYWRTMIQLRYVEIVCIQMLTGSQFSKEELGYLRSPAGDIKPEHITEKHLESARLAQLQCIRNISGEFLQTDKTYPISGGPAYLYTEGEFLRDMMDDDIKAAIWDDELRFKTCADSTISLGYLWIWISVNSRLLINKNKIAKEQRQVEALHADDE
jgi:hypothetical protein